MTFHFKNHNARGLLFLFVLPVTVAWSSLKRALKARGDTTRQKCLPFIFRPLAGSKARSRMSPVPVKSWLV